MTLHIAQWSVFDDEVDSSPHARTLFALGNGHLGLRGSLEEDADVVDQAFVNGFYETWPITYPEDAYGLARTGQTIQPVPNPTRFTLRVDGETFDPHRAVIRGYCRTLDLRTGQLHRTLVWETLSGTAVQVDSTRLVSLAHPGLAQMSYSVRPLTDADVEITGWLTLPQTGSADHVTTEAGADPRRSTHLADALRVVRTACADPVRNPGDPASGRVTNHGVPSLEVLIRTAASGIGVACAVGYQAECDTPVQESCIEDSDALGHRVSAHLRAGQPMTLTALASYSTDGPLLTDDSVPVSDDDLAAAARTALNNAPWPSICKAQEEAMTAWWETADIEADVDERTQGAIRWNLLQCYQSTALSCGAGTPAKGVTGSGYDGHTFWDADAMVVPTLVYTQPDLARSLLSYRYSTLPRARQRAAELHHSGALYPWRTIDGREASAFFEAGTAQYHINADIAYAINRYVYATDDIDFLTTEGIDILVETARFWASLGFFDSAGKFHIHGVTGPDEYSAIVDDNVYTNVMAAANFDAADHWLTQIRRDNEQAWTEICERLCLSDEEIALWTRASKAMTILYDEDLGIHAQDAKFLTHKVWDLAATPPEMHPLLLHYHPLTIYRHQVLKQADLVLALINRPDLFTPEEMRADFDYYDPLTTGDSTLSASPQAIMAARVGRTDLAESYFRTSLVIDLDDTHGNAKDGVHVANAASVWSTLVMGFAGFRDYNGFTLDPHLPPGWRHLSFHLSLRGSLLNVLVTLDDTTLTLISGPPVRLAVYGQDLTVSSRTTVEPR